MLPENTATGCDAMISRAGQIVAVVPAQDLEDLAVAERERRVARPGGQ